MTTRALSIFLFLLALLAHGPGCTTSTGDDVVDDDDDDDDVDVDAGVPDAPPDGPPIVCGNGVCELNEPTSCPGDCTTCGNGVCELGEPSNCPTDCTVCGNHQCEVGEPTGCPSDCTTCGNQVCETGEASTCASDCAATLRVVNNSSSRMYYLYVKTCSASSWGADLLGAFTIAPSGGSFTVNGIPPGCYHFRTEALGGLYWQTPSGVSLTAGLTYTWTLIN